MVEDVRNAISFMASKPGIDADNLAIIGSSLGANLAIISAAQPWGRPVKCVIAISPGLDLNGLSVEKAARNLGSRHVYIAANREDTNSFSAAKRILSMLKGPRELLEIEGADIANQLFSRGLFQKVPLWLFQALLKSSTPPLAGQGRTR